jgi:class 3 adenylate cyclase/tetratricopeptide (TPR) repeat protein
MSFQNIHDIEEAFLSGSDVSIRDLYTIWDQREPVPTAAKKQAPMAPGSAPQLQWLQRDLELVTAFTKQALAKEEYLLVCDVYEEAISYWNKEAEKHPGGLLKEIVALRSHCATAKTRLGFTRSARNILEPLADNLNLGRKEQAKILLQIGDIVREESHHTPDAATRRQTAATALALYQRALVLNPNFLEAMVLTASMLLILAENQPARLEHAKTSARQALTQIEEMESVSGPTFRTIWFRAISYSVLGRLDEAATFYSKLKDSPEATTVDLAEARFRSQFLAEALGQPRTHFYAAFPPLQLLVFSGHVPDPPGRPARFPIESIPQVRELLTQKLDQFEARVGLVSAAAGADLLFIEALQKRPGAKYHVVLPWSKDEFFRTSIAPFEPVGAPPMWEPLFRQALERAATVRELGQVYEPGDAVSWEFTQEVTAGLALLTARMSRLDVKPLVLWDGNPGYGPGGTQSFVELWRQQIHKEAEVIDLPLQAPSQFDRLQPRSRSERLSMHREVKSMLFADVVGYSKMTEKVMGEFVNIFMNRVSVLMATSPHAPRSVNTWGDAIFAVFDFSQDAGQFALALTKMIRDGEEEWKRRGLVYHEYDAEAEKIVERPLNIRVGLHTGPILVHYNPILRQLGFNGSHVNRAARIEPVAEPGEVYASEEFAAMAELGLEISRRDPDTRQPRKDGFVCEYAGTMGLAKNYPGRVRIYRVIPQRTLAMEELARAAHILYCDEQIREGKTRADNVVLRPWEELDEDLRDANRAQVADIPNKLYFLGYELAPSSGLAPSRIAISPEQLEILSRREHDRWVAERQRQGWTYGSERDEARKHHPVLVPWEALSEEEKRKDRDAVHSLPVLIEKAGFQVRKLPRPHA